MNVPHRCKCGKNFSAGRAMICHYEELPISRHNEIRYITTKWLTEVCTDVENEPQLQPLTGETILPRSANKQEEARVDMIDYSREPPPDHENCSLQLQ